jgi:hypothetical protein
MQTFFEAASLYLCVATGFAPAIYGVCYVLAAVAGRP